MNAPSQFLFDGLQLCLHAIPPGLPFDLEFAPTSFAADKGEAQEGEGLRFAEPAPPAGFPPRSVQTRSAGSSPNEATVQTPVTAYASRQRVDELRVDEIVPYM